MTKNKIDTKLAQCKAEGKKALITFITAGDGGYDCTEKAVLEMAKNGADLIELGVPFSDPIAEGPVIQCASERALQNGTTLAGIFDLVRRLRKETDVPLLLMMYLNTIFCYFTKSIKYTKCTNHLFLSNKTCYCSNCHLPVAKSKWLKDWSNKCTNCCKNT